MKLYIKLKSKEITWDKINLKDTANKLPHSFYLRVGYCALSYSSQHIPPFNISADTSAICSSRKLACLDIYRTRVDNNRDLQTEVTILLPYNPYQTPFHKREFSEREGV